jgi:hypothetical protein
MNEEMEQIPNLRRQGKKFQEQILIQVHLLKEAIKVNVQGIISLIIQLLLIMLSMINLYVKMEERIHVHIVVYITIIFQNVGKD